MTCHQRLVGDTCLAQLDRFRAEAGAVGDLCALGRDLASAGVQAIVIEWPQDAHAGHAALAGMVEVQMQLGGLLQVKWVGVPPDMMLTLHALGFGPQPAASVPLPAPERPAKWRTAVPGWWQRLRARQNAGIRTT